MRTTMGSKMGSNQAAISFLTNLARVAFDLGVGAIIVNFVLCSVNDVQALAHESLIRRQVRSPSRKPLGNLQA
ncbi:hypothetical protein RchiOBHm_Chr2g0108681 [Rosa chinensis]|uniref:Uncharacterized protein n=1 Tax=Rosa chinensis TaxID=74649 RepID=A0A2P6RPA1_ROSCH|nr:hypothetical protein RchiOBHm_Chr2g0108681 [Rosa chinensis]